ncbi:MAG: PQQ-binding-like beta-propeller repeat protein, partial [Halioglobus sp.]
YVGTGENYSSPATDTSDAILAFRMADGSLAWKQQFTAGDAWNVACVSPIHHNCPEERGGDLDFGAPPIVANVEGRDIVLAGQKSGRVFALDPDRNGELLWTSKPGGGGKAGGVHFGMAIHPGHELLFVPISDRDVGVLGDSGEGSARPSLHAIDIASGETRWSIDAPGECLDNGDPIDGCFRGFSAPVSVAGELLFAPTLDGELRIFNVLTGEQLWQYDTRQEYPAVNGDTATGGAIDLGGAYIGDGDIYLSSGYGLFNQIPGNAFMVFRPTVRGD